MKRASLITDNERYGAAMCCRLKENGYVADVHLADAIETAELGESDSVVLDAHAAQPKQACRMVRWIRSAREEDISTPFVILTWLPFRRAIVNPQLASNPFIGHYYRASCRFLRLPVRPERLAQVLGEVRPCTKEEISLGKRFLADISHAHRPSSV